MPAKKKTAKKTVKKTVKKIAKKTATKVAKKAPAKKTPAKKAVKKAAKATKKAAVKIAKKGASTKATTPRKKKSKKSNSKSSKSNLAQDVLTAKQLTRISMSMDEIRELLKKREKEDAEARKEAAKTAVPVATKKVETIDAGTDLKNSRHSAASLDDILGLGSAAPQTNKVPRKWKRYYDLLVELRTEVRAELNQHSSDTLKRSQKEESGEVVTSSDAGTDTFDRDFALSILSNEQDALKEIEAAISRIHRGTYGVCEETGEPINNERLEAVPFTRFSLEGKKLHEMNTHRKVQRAGAFLNEVNSEKITFGDDDGDN